MEFVPSLAARGGGQNHEGKKHKETHSDFHRWCREETGWQRIRFGRIREGTGIPQLSGSMG